MSIAERIRSNAAVHGVTWAARHARKNGINLSTVLFVLFGHY